MIEDADPSAAGVQAHREVDGDSRHSDVALPEATAMILRTPGSVSSSKPCSSPARAEGRGRDAVEDAAEPPRQGSTERVYGTIVLGEEYVPGIDGLEPGDELDIV